CKPGQADGCLSPQKLEAVEILMRGGVDSQGRVVYAGMPYDSGISDATWRTRFAHGFMGSARDQARGPFTAFFSPPAPQEDPYKFNLDEWTARTAEAHAVTDPTSPDLSAFR